MTVLNRQIEDLMEYHGHLMDRRTRHSIMLIVECLNGRLIRLKF